MFDAFAHPIAWVTPGGLGFFLACIGILMWGLSKYEKNKSK